MHYVDRFALGLQWIRVREVGTVVNLPRNGWPKNYCKSALTSHPVDNKKPRIKSKELQASLGSVKVSLNDATIRKGLGKNGSAPRQKTLLTKKNTKAYLTKMILMIPKTFGQNFCGTSCQHDNTMVWGCFATLGPGRLVVIDGAMTSLLY